VSIARHVIDVPSIRATFAVIISCRRSIDAPSLRSALLNDATLTAELSHSLRSDQLVRVTPRPPPAVFPFSPPLLLCFDGGQA